MARKADDLNGLAVSRLGTPRAPRPKGLKDGDPNPRTGPGLHAVGTVPGLYLQVLPSGARTWILRAVMNGKRRDMGLGGYPGVTLAMAWEKARNERALIDRGIDPIAERVAARSATRAARAAQITFKEATERYLKAHEAGWRNEKHRWQWSQTLEAHAFPVFGTMLVKDIEVRHVISVLEPIWKERTETASRLRGRIERVLDWATARGYRAGLNPARWRGHLDTMLPAPSKLAKIEHYPALPLFEIGAFMSELRARDGTAARTLEFAILCAARSGEVRGALWSEMNLRDRVWTVPAGRMKAQREHRVPLSEHAVELLRALPRIGGSDLVFPAPNGGTLSDMTLTAVIRRMNEGEEGARWIDPKSGKQAVPHGFRSTFRDWAAERTNYPREMAEMALAHTIENKVEAAYRRGDLFEKRRRMMDDWTKFCGKVERKGQVIPMHATTSR